MLFCSSATTMCRVFSSFHLKPESPKQLCRRGEKSSSVHPLRLPWRERSSLVIIDPFIRYNTHLPSSAAEEARALYCRRHSHSHEELSDWLQAQALCVHEREIQVPGSATENGREALGVRRVCVLFECLMVTASYFFASQCFGNTVKKCI